MQRERQGAVTATLPRPARNAARGRPRSRLYEIAHRIADRLSPELARAFVKAVERLQNQVDETALEAALASGNLSQIEMAAGAGRLAALLLGGEALVQALERPAAIAGAESMDVLAGITGVEARFNARHANVILFAREQAAELVVRVSDDVREAIRLVVALGADQGLTPAQQARAIREVIGLPANWAAAPSNFADELRNGILNRSRLLHDPLLAPRRRRAMRRRIEAEIEAALRAGEVDEEFIARMQSMYTRNLLNRRALNIAGTETRRAALHGLRESWTQAVQQGALPANARRHWIVTPDDRLRPTHAAVPGMNPDGVPLDGVFQTPLGPSHGAPLEPNCRCGEGLSFPGRPGVL